MADLGIEAALWEKGFRRVAGVDEAGRGPLAGPVVVAAVILPLDWKSAVVLDDSKRLTESQREAAYRVIRARALAWRAVAVPPGVIDRINILNATLDGMARSLARLKPEPDYALVDGNRLPALSMPAEALVKGDSRSLSVAAASIVAKVVRDRLMRVYGSRYPQWGFERHKGYGTAAHCKALAEYGASPIHRRSFRPVAAVTQQAAQRDEGGEERAWPTERGSARGARQLRLAIWNG